MNGFVTEFLIPVVGSIVGGIVVVFFLAFILKIIYR